MVEASGGDCDQDRHLAMARFGRAPGCIHFHLIVSARSVECLQPAWYVRDPVFSIRLLDQVEHLTPQGLGSVDGLSGKSQLAKKILSSLRNQDRRIDMRAILSIVINWWINLRVEEALRNIKAMNEFRAFFHIGRNKGEIPLELRITFPSRPDRAIEEQFGRLTSVADEIYQPQSD